MKKTLLVIFLLISLKTLSQDRNSVWCFGDSVGMNFNSGTPMLFTPSVKSRGSSVSICDSIGQLQFYAYTRATIPGNTTLVKNRNHILMQNGNNIIGRGWYQELVVIPFPNDTTKYYLFSVGVTSIYGLYYSAIDMTLDSGRGGVSLKNNQLQTYMADDCIMAIKHGNGRDWWILSRHADNSNNDFYEYLVSPSGISSPIVQSAGTPSATNNYRFAFSKDGSMMISVSASGLIELFDFDRCTGILSLSQTIANEVSAGSPPWYFGVAFSPNSRYLYISQTGISTPESYLFQLDLQAPNIFASADTIWTYNATENAAGLLMLAPDNKIYMASAWYDGLHFNYPYPDSVFNTINNNLSVINYPDSPGVACGFAPFSFNLGAGRTYWGLPNNPDYELGPDTNSMCDTIMQVGNMQLAVGKNSRLNVFYHHGWQIAFINAEGLSGKKYSLVVYDLTGRIVFRETGNLSSQYFTKDLPFDEFSSGIYIVRLQTEKEVLSNKFLKE